MTLLSAKSLVKQKQFIRCFELLQREFVNSPQYTSILFIYGKSVVKAIQSQEKLFLAEQKKMKEKKLKSDLAP